MRSTEQRGVWALTYGDELAIWSDEEGCILPVWSDEQQPGVGLKVFPGHEVTSYSLVSFVAEVLPQLHNKDVMIGLNLDPYMAGMDVSCAEFKRLFGTGDA